jgi:hypothetical protein
MAPDPRKRESGAFVISHACISRASRRGTWSHFDATRWGPGSASGRRHRHRHGANEPHAVTGQLTGPDPAADSLGLTPTRAAALATDWYWRPLSRGGGCPLARPPFPLTLRRKTPLLRSPFGKNLFLRERSYLLCCRGHSGCRSNAASTCARASANAGRPLSYKRPVCSSVTRSANARGHARPFGDTDTCSTIRTELSTSITRSRTSTAARLDAAARAGSHARWRQKDEHRFSSRPCGGTGTGERTSRTPGPARGAWRCAAVGDSFDGPFRFGVGGRVRSLGARTRSP